MLKKDVLRTYNLISGSKLKKPIGCYRSPGVHAMIIFRFGQWFKKTIFSYEFCSHPYTLLWITGLEANRESEYHDRQK